MAFDDPQNTERPVRVLFVCMGNICRSPLAEALFRHHIGALGLTHGFEVASCGTGGWHVGQGADRRTVAEARTRGVSLDAHRARQFKAADLAHYDHIFVMDRDNLMDVLALDADDAHGHKVRLLRELDETPEDYAVPDPYYGGTDGFARVHDILDRTTRRLAEGLAAHHHLS